MLTAIIFGGIFIFYTIVQLPSVNQLQDLRLQVPLKIYSADGKLIAEYGEKKRTPVSIDQVPKQLIRAIIDTEDQRFYEHKGVDFIGLTRATKNLFLTGKKSEGASTITMQIARNFFLTPEKTYTRKFKEILLAFKIDHEFSKNDILELYLNKVYFGQRAYGVAAAAQIYYGKNLNQLTLPEMAVLAGLPQAPSRDNPLVNPKAALERRNHVLKRMLENDDIDEKTYQQSINTPLDITGPHEQQMELYAPYLAEMVRQVLIEKFGDDVYDQGLKVYTTIDSQAQKIANETLRNGLMVYSNRHGYNGPEKNLNSINHDAWLSTLQQIPVYNNLFPAVIVQTTDQGIIAKLAGDNNINLSWANLSLAKGRTLKIGDVIRVQNIKNHWELTQIPKVNGALVALNPKNGAVLALVGGFSYSLNKFNCASQAGRQPGSSIKPFIYSAALEKGFTLASIIMDAPIVLPNTSETDLWRPQNFTKEFYGPTRLRVALIESRNVVSIRLLQAIGIPYAIEYLQRFGFDPKSLPNTPSLALGTASISPMDLAAGYAVFANGGYRIFPYFINYVENEKGEKVLETKPTNVPEENTQPTDPSHIAERVITAQNAYLMTDVMKDVVRHAADEFYIPLLRKDLAGKTGTTNQQFDAWFAGYNNDVVATVWIGYNEPQSLHEYGAQAALPVWLNFMQQTLAGKPTNSMPQPDGIVSVRIDPQNGLLADPQQKNAIFELFDSRFVPTEKSTGDAADASVTEENSNGLEIF